MNWKKEIKKLTELEFILKLGFVDSRHMLQENVKYPVDCDGCHEQPKVILLCGGGVRECLNCHKCRFMKFIPYGVIEEKIGGKKIAA